MNAYYNYLKMNYTILYTIKWKYVTVKTYVSRKYYFKAYIICSLDISSSLSSLRHRIFAIKLHSLIKIYFGTEIE